jgi:hypothetical protein
MAQFNFSAAQRQKKQQKTRTNNTYPLSAASVEPSNESSMTVFLLFLVFLVGVVWCPPRASLWCVAITHTLFHLTQGRWFEVRGSGSGFQTPRKASVVRRALSRTLVLASRSCVLSVRLPTTANASGLDLGRLQPTPRNHDEASSEAHRTRRLWVGIVGSA